MFWNRMHFLLPLLTGCLLGLLCFASAMMPKFDPTTRMRLVLVPADAAVGSVIYRIRATDEEFDYPLQFDLVGDSASSTVQIETLPCTKYNSVCQANVLLKRRLEAGRYYDFQISVKDTKGDSATQSCSITATNFTTPHDLLFPHKPAIIMIPEDAKRGTELDYVIARKNPLFPKPVYLELWGSALFGIRQKIVTPEMTEGTIFLLGPLDFEKQSMYHLSILANDAYAEPGQDSRNIAGLEVVIIVEDVQDVPPIFTMAPPVTKLPTGLLPGDKILKVEAEDGDKGVPREIRYGLVSENNPFTSFFNINDTTGEIFLLRPLDEIAAITHIGDPVLLTVVAEEVKVTRDEPPAMATTVQLAFIMPERENSPPYFENDHYVTRLDENSPLGTALSFNDPYVPRVYDDDTGKNGVFSLTLLNNNGTFEISPNVAERRASFVILVRDNSLLDYEETKSVQFQILAQELGPATNLSAVVNITVFLNDVNDNPPVFGETSYMVELPENMTTGTKLVQVHADDVDEESGGRVRYTSILGFLNTSLNLDAESGIITVSTDNHGFDREQMPEYHFYVEARDDDGTGNIAQVPLILKVSDVNDEMPIFEKSVYEFILTPDLRNFTSAAFIRAIDNDAEPPNNVIRYEIINGNYENKFKLNEVTGQLSLRAPLDKMDPMAEDSVTEYSLTVRAFDLGVPVQYSMATIRIYPPESRARTLLFLVPNYDDRDRLKTEDTLSDIIGGKVTILDAKPYTGNEQGTILGDNSNMKDKSIVTASVLYDSKSVVDITKIQQRLSNKNTTMGILTYDDNVALSTHKAENRLLFWLLIFLAFLIALLILTLLFCCICSWCPLYGLTRKRVIRVSSTEDDVHLVHRDTKGNTKESKSVQVAEWMGRREAWSADRSGDSRTKPTRWEFKSRHLAQEKLDDDDDGQHHHHEMEKEVIEPSHLDNREANRSAKGRKSEKRSVKHSKINNSRTNLINDRDVYVEDVDGEDNDYDRVDENQRHGKYIHHHTHHHHHEGRQSQNQLEVPPIDDDSMRRHELDRGSDIGYDQRGSLKRQQAEEDPTTRDQLFIKDGNAEILRLITRGKRDEENIYVNVPPQQAPQVQNQIPQYIMVDNGGKEILMRRYIEEQSNGKHVIREHYQVVPGPTYIQSIPNEVQQTQQQEPYVQKSQPESQVGVGERAAGLQFQEHLGTHQVDQESQMVNANSHHSLIQQELENSLKQQNALLRQILLEKEKLEERYNQQETAMETQSLPCNSLAIGTQTDCDAGTQTDPIESAKPKRRRARSENDESDSEDGYEYVRYSPPNSPNGVYFLKRRKSKRSGRGKEEKKKRIVMVEAVKRKIKTPIQEECEEQRSSPKHKERSKVKRSEGRDKSPSSLNKKILVEISDSLDEQIIPKIQSKKKYFSRTYLTAEPSPRADRRKYEEDEDSSEHEIIMKNYSGDSLDDQSDVEEDKIKATKRADPRNKIFSRQGSSTEARDALEQISEIIAKSRPSSRLDKIQSAVLSEDGRMSRRDAAELPEKGRRQTASEPPQGRMQKGPAPKPPDSSKSRRSTSKEKTRSENDMLSKVVEEGIEGAAKSVPRYMEWYFNNKDKDKEVKDTTGKGDKPKPKVQSKKLTPGLDKTKPKKSSPMLGRTEKAEEEKYKPEPLPRRTSPPKGPPMLKETIQMAKNLEQKHQPIEEGSHALLQHSEHRFEHEYSPAPTIPPPPTKLPHYLYPETPPQVNRETKINVRHLKATQSPIKEDEEKHSKTTTCPYQMDQNTKQLNASTLEDDHDSGIAMNSLLHNMGRRNPIVDKKSIFAIAYDDVKVSKIRSESESSPVT